MAESAVKFARGAWSEEEHLRFLDAMEQFPKGPWKAIAELVGSRSVRQVQTHAQQHHEKIARQLLGFRREKTAGRAEANDDTSPPLENKDIVARWRELEAQRTVDGILAPASTSMSASMSSSSSPSSSRSGLSPPLTLVDDTELFALTSV